MALRDGAWGLLINDPIYGSFPAQGLTLEVSPDGTRWLKVTEHELLALLGTVS